MRTAQEGNIVVEAVFGLGVILFASVFAIELTRRSFYDFVLHHVAFLAARAKGIGATQSREVESRRGFLEGSLGLRLGRTVLNRMEVTAKGSEKSHRAHVFYRFPALLRFPFRGGSKHHFEVVKECRFPLSSD